MRHIFMTVFAAACLLMNATAGAETPAADNAIKSVRQDLTRFERQAKGLTPSRKANIKRMQRLMKITRGRLNSSPNKTHPS
jgi:NifB/MoaA-like Fe-S oxidoreductase